MTPAAPRYRLTAPARLHFGLLARGREAPRQFGSAGLMIDEPALIIEAAAADRPSAQGPHARRVETIVARIRETLQSEGIDATSLHLSILAAPPEHAGLGLGTQLSLAVARLILEASGQGEPDVARLAALTGRGARSGIGIHGFLRGGLIVDGGRGESSPFPPLLASLELPPQWSILVATPPVAAGPAGIAEREAFASLPDPDVRTIDRLCRLVLLGLLPAAAESDLPAFGAALEEIQREVGVSFAPAQGGRFAHRRLESLACIISEAGLVGVGQSSWGPTLYAFAEADDHRRAELLRSISERAGLDPSIFTWTTAAKSGARLERIDAIA
jgi:beta-RFAP synthase